MKRTKLKDRILPTYTKGEEIFNMTSHIVGAVLGIVATVLCVVFAAINGNGYGVVSGAIYGFTMILLYTMSSIYHGLSPKRHSKKVFQKSSNLQKHHNLLLYIVQKVYMNLLLIKILNNDLILGILFLNVS